MHKWIFLWYFFGMIIAWYLLFLYFCLIKALCLYVWKLFKSIFFHSHPWWQKLAESYYEYVNATLYLICDDFKQFYLGEVVDALDTKTLAYCSVENHWYLEFANVFNFGRGVNTHHLSHQLKKTLKKTPALVYKKKCEKILNNFPYVGHWLWKRNSCDT